MLTGIERHEHSALALDSFSGGFDRDAAVDDFHHGPLAHPVIAEFISTLKVDHDRPTLGGREKHARHLPA
jgi:hypothetical protein